VTLPDNRKEKITFRNSEDHQQIAQRIMSKNAIPGQKLRNIENIYTDHSCERSLNASSPMLTGPFPFSEHFIANKYYLSYRTHFQ
jgi:hypothetical protein